MKHIFTISLCFLALSLSAQVPLLEEDFESYSVGDYIGVASSVWTTWSGNTGTDEDAQVSDEQANSGTQSLKIFGSATTGGPMDVYLPIGLDDAYEVSFNIYVPSGYSAYLNVQEQLTNGLAWAFDMVFAASGTINFGIDQVVIAYGAYYPNTWNSVSMKMDPANDRAEIMVNGEYLANVPFDDIIGGLNFFGYGDGNTAGLYYIDDVVVVETDDVFDDDICIFTCYGCTTPFACNYNPEATEDDGSCIFICEGCTDEGACNYDPSANLDDSSCEYLSCAGCTDATACNFTLSSTIDDGSCLYPEQYYNCGGGCVNDSDSDGICDELETSGCIDEGSCNFNLEATDDDGSCEYETCAGCQYEFACNYDPESTIADNESCEYGTCPGCTDSTACNYNPTVSEDDGSCLQFDLLGVCGGDAVEECVINFSFNNSNTTIESCLELGTVNQDYYDVLLLHIPTSASDLDEAYPPTVPIDSISLDLVTFIDDASFAEYSPSELGIQVTCNNNGDSGNPCSFLGGEQYSVSFDGSPIIPGVFRIKFEVTGWLTIFSPFSVPFASDPFILNIAPNTPCLDPFACNYLEDNSSCLYLDECGVCGGDNTCIGCTDETACNYDSGATQDDGSCAINDCAGVCGGDAVEDECGVCLGTCLGCEDGETQISIVIIADDYPDEISWTLSFGDNQIASGGGGSNNETICLEVDYEYPCFNFQIFDSFGDGIFEPGGYWIYLDGVEVGTGGNYAYNEELSFACEPDCEGNVYDECGVCGGLGIPEGVCDCEGNVLDECGVCGGLGIPEGDCDCEGNVLDECGVCGGLGIAEGACDCEGNVLDECGVCGGLGIAEGACDCDGNMIDAVGICGGDCEYDFNSNGVCDDQEVYGCTYPDSPSYNASATADDGSCVFYIIDNFCPADLDFNGIVGSPDLLLFLSAYGDVCE